MSEPSEKGMRQDQGDKDPTNDDQVVLIGTAAEPKGAKEIFEDARRAHSEDFIRGVKPEVP